MRLGGAGVCSRPPRCNRYEGEGSLISDPLPMIVIVEDEILVRAGTARYLREAGFAILEATTAEECLALLATEKSIKVCSPT